MPTQRLGIIMHGVTGRMGMNQHLIRSIVAIRAQGGVALANGDKVMPDPILVGRNEDKIAALARALSLDVEALEVGGGDDVAGLDGTVGPDVVAGPGEEGVVVTVGGSVGAGAACTALGRGPASSDGPRTPAASSRGSRGRVTG